MFVRWLVTTATRKETKHEVTAAALQHSISHYHTITSHYYNYITPSYNYITPYSCHGCTNTHIHTHTLQASSLKPSFWWTVNCQILLHETNNRWTKVCQNVNFVILSSIRSPAFVMLHFTRHLTKATIFVWIENMQLCGYSE